MTVNPYDVYLEMHSAWQSKIPKKLQGMKPRILIALLKLAASAEGVSQSEAASKLGLTQWGVSRISKKLIRERWVTVVRRSKPHHRHKVMTTTPKAGLIIEQLQAQLGAGSFNVTLSATNSSGTGTATLALTLAASGTTATLFNSTDTPSIVTVSDPQAVNLGVEFQASTNGTITSIRFYKGPKNTGTHIGALWTASGTLLASSTFTNETASGWQQVNFSKPVSITANTTYVASYHTNRGEYSANGNYFANAHTNGLLTAPSSASIGGNGVYAYSGSNVFPNSTYHANNY